MKQKHGIVTRMLTFVLSLAMAISLVNLPGVAVVAEAAEMSGTRTETEADRQGDEDTAPASNYTVEFTYHNLQYVMN